MRAVCLVGFMGAGKSSVGRRLAEHLGWEFEDLDERIVRREGRSIAMIFREAGELEFREAEHAALRQMLDELPNVEGKVIALGGGSFAQPQNHAVIQNAGVFTVFLQAPLTELWRRCEAQSDAKRPLQKSRSTFRETYKARLPYYRTAQLTVETAGKQIEAVAAEIAAALSLGDQQ